MQKVRPTPKRVPDPQQGCPLNECLRVLAGAWTSEVVWYLQAGPRRFGDLQRDVGRVSAKVLTTRLRDLQARGVVVRTVYPSQPPTVEYELTGLGRRLQPVLDAIVEIGKELGRRGQPAAIEPAACGAGLAGRSERAPRSQVTLGPGGNGASRAPRR